MKRMLVFGVALLVVGAGFFAYFRLGQVAEHSSVIVSVDPAVPLPSPR